MRKFLALTLAVLALGFAGGNALGFEVNPELENFEKSLEARLQERIRTVFGADTKLGVTVHAQAEKPAPPKQNAVSNIDIDRGPYAPFPLDLMNGDFADGETEKTPGLKISQLDIALQVPDDLDNAVIEDVKTLLKNSLKAYYAPRISVVKLPAPKARNLASTSPTAGEGKEAEANPWIKAILPHIGLFGAALLLSLAILVIGLGLKSAVRSIGEGLRVQAATNSNVTLTGKAMDIGGSMEVKNSGGSDAAAKNDTATAASQAASLQVYGRNIRLVQQLLKDDPMLFAQSLRETESEWMGVRSLLPVLTPEDQENLKRAVGPARMARLAAVSASHLDPPGWLREFAERMMLKKVQGGNRVEKTLGAEKSIAFTMTTPANLIAVAKEVNTRAAWRIAMDFLPKDQLTVLLGSLEEAQWQLLVSAAAVTSDEITEAAAQMLARLKDAPAEDTEAKERAEYLRETLLEPVVRVVAGKEPGQDDVFLDSLTSEAPELAELVRKKVWTLSQLVLVPTEALTQALRDLTHEEKALLLIALPEREAKRLEAGLPQGNVRTIVLDQMRAIQSRNQAEEKRAAIEVARRFLEHLRRQAEAKKFELLNPMGLKEAA